MVRFRTWQREHCIIHITSRLISRFRYRSLQVMQSNQRILLIEDEKDARELYTEIIKFAGYQVESAGDGEEGLTKAQQGGYALILLDLMMPKLDGISVLKKLQTSPPKMKNGPIVILTNLAHDPVLEQAMALGANAFIIKTDVNPDLLSEKIKSFIPEE